MNHSPTSPARPSAKQTGPWMLEIVRGRDVGRTFALGSGETVVGNALNGQRGLDLLDQEGNSPRRMAARHAALACSGQDLSIQDLESPGGTFVNQQRLLSGQPRKLAPGDVVQLGGVQLKVKQDAAAAGTGAATVAPTEAKRSAAPASSSTRQSGGAWRGRLKRAFQATRRRPQLLHLGHDRPSVRRACPGHRSLSPGYTANGGRSKPATGIGWQACHAIYDG